MTVAAGQGVEEKAGEGPGAEESGRARVRRLLVGRVQEAGLVRARGVTAEAHQAAMGKLAEHLAYMSAENLQTLAEVVIDNAGGRSGNEWPAETLVRSWAQALQPAPPQRHRIVTSWLASVEGPKAEAAGHLVELYRFLLLRRVPPGPYDLRRITEEAAENARRRVLIRDRVARDCATDEDRRWLAEYLRHEAEARAVIEDARARRAGEGEGGAA